MIRDNLRVAITNSGLIVKEIAANSGVNKRTIDKWVGTSETEPKVNDFYKVCKVLKTTMECIVDGDAGAEYAREIVKNDHKAIHVPDKIQPIVEYLLVLEDRELRGILALVENLAADKKLHQCQVPKRKKRAAGETGLFNGLLHAVVVEPADFDPAVSPGEAPTSVTARAG